MISSTDPFSKLCPRLADYLCIVGTNEHTGGGNGQSNNTNSTLGSNSHDVIAGSSSHIAYIRPPELLRRYPPVDHKDFPLPLNMVSFCQPEGCLTLGHKKNIGVHETSSFVFTLTDKDSGLTRYGICLNFFRPVEVCGQENRAEDEKGKANNDEEERDEASSSWQIGSDSAFSSDYRSSLSLVAASDSDQGESCSHQVGNRQEQQKPQGKTHGDFESEEDEEDQVEVSPSARGNGKREKRNVVHSLTSLCLLSHHPFVSNFRECLQTLKHLVDVVQSNSCRKLPSSSRSKEKKSMGKKLRRSVWSILLGTPTNAPPPSPLLMHDIREIETWILKLLSAPVPVPGNTRVELDISPQNMDTFLASSSSSSPMIFALPDSTRFSLCDFPMHLPIELLGVETCLTVLSLILLERKIVVQSGNYSALTFSVLALLHLIYPIEYVFPVIPLLPLSMSGSEQLLLAPTPYVIGVPTNFLNCKRGAHNLPEDVWLVDLDTGQIKPPDGVELSEVPPLPEPEAKVLKNHLKQVLASMSIQPIKNFDEMTAESLSKIAAQHDTFSSPSICGFNPFIYGNDIDSVDIATRIAMVRFFTSSNMLANFSDHTRTLRLYPRPIVAFQTSSFLRTRTKTSPFVAQFAQSQALEYFAEWSLMPTNVAFQRVQAAIYDPKLIGDKAKWFAKDLEPIRFTIWDDQSSLSSILKTINNSDKEEQATDESGSDSDAFSSSSSCSSLSDLVNELVENERRQSLVHHYEEDSAQKNDDSDSDLDETDKMANIFKMVKVQKKKKNDEKAKSPMVLPTGLDVRPIFKPPKRFVLPGISLADVTEDESKSVSPADVSSSHVEDDVEDVKSTSDPLSSSASNRENSEKIDTFPLANPHRNKRSSHSDEVFVSSDEEDVSVSEATTKTMRNTSATNLTSAHQSGNGNVHHFHHHQMRPGSPQSFGSDLSIAGSLSSELGAAAGSTAGTITPKHSAKMGNYHMSSQDSVTSLTSTGSGNHASNGGVVASGAAAGSLPKSGSQTKLSFFDQISNQARDMVRKEPLGTSSLFGELGKLKKQMTPTTKASSSSSTSAPKPTEEKQSSTDELSAQELFANIEQLTKNVTDSIESISTMKVKSNGSLSRKDTLQNVVSDISRTAKSKKFEFLKAFGGSDSSTPEASTSGAQKDSVAEEDAEKSQEKSQRRTSREFLRSVSKDIIENVMGGQEARQVSPTCESNKNGSSLAMVKNKNHDEVVPGDGSELAKTPTTELRGRQGFSVANGRLTSSGDIILARKARLAGARQQQMREMRMRSCSPLKGPDSPMPSSLVSSWRFHEHPGPLSLPPSIAKRTSPRPSMSGITSPSSLDPSVNAYTGDERKGLKDTVPEDITHSSKARKPLSKLVMPNLQVCANTIRHDSDFSSPESPEPPSVPPPPPPSELTEKNHQQLAPEKSQSPPSSPKAPLKSPKQSDTSSPRKRLTSLDSASCLSAKDKKPISPSRKMEEESHQKAFTIKTETTPNRSLIRSNSTLSSTSTLSQSTQDFFAYLSSTDLTGLAAQTSSMIGGLFDSETEQEQLAMAREHADIWSQQANCKIIVFEAPASQDFQKGSRPASPSQSSRDWETSSTKSLNVPSASKHSRERGPFPRGRRGLAERSHLIRHPSSKQKQMDILKYQEEANELVRNPTVTVENNAFIKDVIDHVFHGDGISWLKHNRLRKLMEDESYRTLTLGRLNRALDRKFENESFLDDVCLERSVCKGLIKILLAILHGIEVSIASCHIGGVASAFYALEIAYTHYWTKSITGTDTELSSSFISETSSPAFGSRENLSKVSGSPRNSWAATLSTVFYQQGKSGESSGANGDQSENVSSDNVDSKSEIKRLPLKPFQLALEKRGSQTELSSATSNSGKLVHDNLNSPGGASIHSSSSEHAEQQGLSPRQPHLPASRQKAISKLAMGEKTASIESNASATDNETSDTQSLACSETGSLMTNPVYRPLNKTDNMYQSSRSVLSDSEIEQAKSLAEKATEDTHKSALNIPWPRKSSLSSGFRFRDGKLLETVSSGECSRSYLYESLVISLKSNPVSSLRRSSLGIYGGGSGSGIWESMQFWEDIFCDAVALEREAIALDTGPGELMERYRSLSESEKKRLEQEEDKLLSTMLYNVTAFMVMMQMKKQDIKKKVRRLLGKCHIGLQHSEEINSLLEHLQNLNGNDIDLKPLPSRQMRRQSFAVHIGTDSSGDLLFMETREDGVILRSASGCVLDRWFYERLVNMTYSPKTKVLCLWRREGGQTQLHKFYTKKCKELYYSIKSFMERAASKGIGDSSGSLNMELGGEFPVEDLTTGEGGLLQVCMEGVGLLFAHSKFFVQLEHIRKCFTQRGGIFVLEEFNSKTRVVVQRRYKSAMADQICYSVLCVFSYVAAGQRQRTRPSSVSSMASSVSSTPRKKKMPSVSGLG